MVVDVNSDLCPCVLELGFAVARKFLLRDHILLVITRKNATEEGAFALRSRGFGTFLICGEIVETFARRLFFPTERGTETESTFA